MAWLHVIGSPELFPIKYNCFVAWMDLAACKGKTELMFPLHHNDKTYTSVARQICSACPVKQECLEYALQFPMTEMHGVWAGMSPGQLAREQRRRGLKATRPTIQEMLVIRRNGTTAFVEPKELVDAPVKRGRGRPRKNFG